MLLIRNSQIKLACALIGIGLTGCGHPPEPTVKACPTLTYATHSIESANFIMGSSQRYREEVERAASVSAFDIDIHEVTNLQFKAFVDATGFITTAERPQAGFDAAGAAVFMPPNAIHPNWWRFIEGANWRHPEGPESNIDAQDNYPVVQVSFEDAVAYAAWAKRALPTEAQWEYAARAKSETQYVWGEDRAPDGIEMANTWQGAFPLQNVKADGYDLRAPAGCYPANDFGLYDMIGNVWEWTASETSQSTDIPVHVIKGGSFLCSENYCARYRSAAWQFQEVDLPKNHIGFRTVSAKTP